MKRKSLHVRIRPIVRGDIDQIPRISGQVHHSLKSQRSRFFGEIREFSKSEDFYIRVLKKRKSQEIFVAEVPNGEIVGYVYVIIEKRPDDLTSIPYVSIEEIAVDKEYQNRGVGKALMDKAREWVQGRNIKIIQLATWEFNKNARRFFESLGYKTIMRKMELVLPQSRETS